MGLQTLLLIPRRVSMTLIIGRSVHNSKEIFKGEKKYMATTEKKSSEQEQQKSSGKGIPGMEDIGSMKSAVEDQIETVIKGGKEKAQQAVEAARSRIGDAVNRYPVTSVATAFVLGAAAASLITNRSMFSGGGQSGAGRGRRT